jgi:hypothetical protein
MKAKMGRPRQEITRAVLIGARYTPEEAALIEKAVSDSKRVKSDWIRETLLAAAGAPGGRPVLPPPSAPSVFQQANEEFLD